MALKRDVTIATRFRGPDAELVSVAANRRGITVSELVREAVLQEARRILTPTPTAQTETTE